MTLATLGKEGCCFSLWKGSGFGGDYRHIMESLWHSRYVGCFALNTAWLWIRKDYLFEDAAQLLRLTSETSSQAQV